MLDCEQGVDEMDNLHPANPYGIDDLFDCEGNFRPTEIYHLDIGDGDYLKMEFTDYVDYCVRNTTLDTSNSGELLLGEPDPAPDPSANLRATDVLVRGKPLNVHSLQPYFLWTDNQAHYTVWPHYTRPYAI